MFLLPVLPYAYVLFTALASSLMKHADVTLNLLKPSGNFTYEQV
jgi:hypothetical protein